MRRAPNGFPKLVRKITKSEIGGYSVYVIYGSREVLYVGCSSDVDLRLQTHQRTKKWFSDMVTCHVFAPTDRVSAMRLETRAIEHLRPIHNIADSVEKPAWWLKKRLADVVARREFRKRCES